MNEVDTTAQDEADFQASFNAMNGANSVAKDAQKKTGEAESAPTEAPFIEPDLNAEAPKEADVIERVNVSLEELKALKAAAAAIPQLASRLSKAEGRLGDLNGRIKAAPPPEPPRLEKFERVRAELPEVADALEEYVASRMPREAAQAKAPEEAQPLSTPVLDDERPTWREDIWSSEFQTWLKSQDRAYQEKVAGTDSEAVMMAALGRFDSHKASRAQVQAQPQLNKASKEIQDTRNARIGAATPIGSSARRPPQAANTEQDDFNRGFRLVAGQR